MAKFCTKCGKELQGDKPCNCKNNLKKEKVESSTKYQINDIIGLLKKMVSSPIDTVKDLIQKHDFDLSIILIAINSIMVAVLAVMSLKQIYYLHYGNIMYQMNIPYFRYFMITIMFVILAYIIFASVNYLIFRIYNKNVEFKEMINLSAISLIPITIASFIGIFISFISIPLTLIILFISILISFINLYEGMMKITNIDNNKAAYISSISLIAYIFIYIILIQIIL